MNTEDNADGADDGDSPGDGFKELRAQLRNLPRRTAPAAFEAQLERRLASRPGAPRVRLLRIGPLVAAVTTLGGLIVFLSFLLFPGRIDTTRSSAVAPVTESAADVPAAKIGAKIDTVGGDSLARIRRISTAVP